MARRTCQLALLCSLLTCLAASAALADEETGVYSKDDWPLATIKRPLTLAPSMLEIRGDTLMINLSSDLVGKPIAIAPDIYYGVSEKLSIGLTHVTGFCLGGTDKGCIKAYNDLGIDAIYGLMRAGNLQVAAHGGVIIPAFSPDLVAGLDGGLTLRLGAGKIAFVLSPTVYVGAIGRDKLAAGPNGPKETLDMPVAIQFQANNQTMAFLSTGLGGPLSGFGDSYRVPIGLGLNFAVNNRADVGAEFSFPNLAGKGDNRADARVFIARAALRL
jgi:hypothetical protein